MRKSCTVNDTVTFEYDRVGESIRKLPLGNSDEIVRFLIFTIDLTLQEASSFLEDKEDLFALNGNITEITTEFEEGVPFTFSSDYKYIDNIYLNYEDLDSNGTILASINFRTKESDSSGENTGI